MDYERIIIFRVDGNNDIIGFGHVMRCIHLAKEFSENGFKSIFIMKNFTEVVNKVKENNIEVNTIPVDIESNDELNMLKEFFTDNKLNAMILDKWNLEQEYLDMVKKETSNLIVVNDYGKLDLRDLFIINVNDNLNYKNEIKDLSCIGLSYAIISDDLFNYRNSESIVNDKVKTIVISMGGSDSSGLTMKVIKYLNQCEDLYNIIAILGPESRHVDDVKRLCSESRHKFDIISDPKSMGEYFFEADIAVISGGVTKFETAFLGIPSIVLCQNIDEDMVTRLFEKHKIFINLGVGSNVKFEEFLRIFSLLTSDSDLRYEISLNGKRLIDGLGKKRIVERIKKYIELNV